MAGSILIGGAEADKRKVRGVAVLETEALDEGPACVPEFEVQAARASAELARVPVSSARRDTRRSGKSGTGMAHLPLASNVQYRRRA